MGFEALLVETLQKMSCGFTDFLFLAITMLGDEIFFLCVAVLLYWCFDKRFAFKFFNIYILGTAASEGLKSLVCRPRPFAAYPDTIVSIGEKTSGYSFPSGHSQSISNISTQIFLKYRKKVFLILGIAFTALVMFSRLYLGQHYLTDVLAGTALGIGLSVLLTFLYRYLGEKEERILFVTLPLCLVLFIIIAIVGISPNLENVLKVLGGYTAFGIGYYIEKRFIRLNVKSDKLYKQFIKVALGLGVTLLLKEGLKFVFPKDILALYAYLRYFIVALWASCGSMAIFKLLKL